MRSALVLVPALAAGWLVGTAPARPQGQDYAGQNLAGKNFADENLNRAHLEQARARAANFRNATLKNASLIGADLRGANFRKANLEAADFTEAKLDGASFTDAKAWRAVFAGCEIHLARATPLDLGFSKLDLTAPGVADLIRAGDEPTCGTLSFRYADLHNALVLGNAAGVDFRDADLRGADLGHARNLDEALLAGAKYDDETRWAVNPDKVGAVFQAGGRPPRHPLVGKWLILKGVEGAPDHGTLHLWRDNTFEWDPALSLEKPRTVAGYWTEKGGAIELVGGEGGRVWTAEKHEHNGKPEIRLRSDNGQVRVGAADY